MKWYLAFGLLLAIVLLLLSCRSRPPLPVVPSVDLARYQGRWYEIASIPLRFSRNCTCTFAEYTADSNGYVKVYNECRNNKTGKTDSIRGKAFPVKGSNNAKLKVQFFWPFRGDYYIIDLDPGYTRAMVGSPDRNTLWILSRERTMEDSIYHLCLAKATSLGFNVAKLRRTSQHCK